MPLRRLCFIISGPILNFWLSFAFAGLLLLVTTGALAQEDLTAQGASVDGIGDGNVEIIYPASRMDPYRERRSDWAIQFAINYENFMPLKFTSSNDGKKYSELFGENSMALIQGELGLKYNFMLGALTFDLMAGSASISDARSKEDRGLWILKRAAAFGYTMDAVMKEPYIAPYAKFQIFDFMYKDKGSAAGDSRGTTAWTTGFTLGLLIQLNSIDPTETALAANRDYGLNNTYLDVFATQYNTSNAKDDPQFMTSLNWGAGIRLEF